MMIIMMMTRVLMVMRVMIITCRWDPHFLAYLLELYSYNVDGSDYFDGGIDDMMLIIAIMMTVIDDNDDLNTTRRWDPHFLGCLSWAEARSVAWGDNIWLRFRLQRPLSCF